MKDKETPLPLVRLWSKIAKGCYEQLDNCRAAKDTGEMQWPDYCPLPINAAYTYLVRAHGLTDDQAASGCAELTACWIWRQNKIIYHFDSDLASILAEQAEDVSDTDVLPAELLMRLPYPCVYIKAPILLEHADGFWAWMDYDANRQGPELRIQWVLDTMTASVPQVLHIIPGETLRECFLDTLRTTMEHTKETIDTSRAADNSRIILRAIQLLLYILADNSDMEDAPPQGDPDNSQKPAIKKSGKQKIQDKAGEIAVKDVGVRIGAAFRHSQAGKSVRTGSGGVRRPHLRRGHWHHYWRGKRGQRELILKWTAPAMIHPELGVGDEVVVYPVKGKK